MIEIEVQNETTQTQSTVRFATVPRTGEGVHLKDEAGFWCSYDVVDVWYQKAAYGDVWIPYLHVRQTPHASGAGDAANDAAPDAPQPPSDSQAAQA